MTRSTDNMDETKLTPVATDGGRGWLVVLGAFIAYFIADGWSYSFGAFYPYILEYLEEGKGKTALVAALLYGMPCIISPFVCALTEAYGCRRIAITGGIIMAISLITSMFANSVNLLCLTIGVIGSVGLSMTYIPSLVIVTFHFERFRGLATGLAVTGSGLGSFALPPLAEYLMQVYGVRGTLLILGGLCLHIIVAGALYSPPSLSSKPKIIRKHSEDLRSTDNLEEVMCMPRTFTTDAQSLCERTIVAEETNLHGNVNKRYSASSPDIISLDKCDRKNSADELSVASVDIKCSKNCWQKLLPIFKSMFDPSLLKIWPYVIFCASNFLTYLWAGLPYVYLVDHAMAQNISVTHSVFLLSIIGILRTIGQLVLGALGDLTKSYTMYLYGLCIFLTGMSLLALPFCKTMLTLSMFAAGFGFFISVTYSLQMMCVVMTVGVANTTRAFGMLQLIQGISTLLGTPVAGWLFDATNAYDPSFYTAGVCIAGSGLMLLIIPRSLLQTRNAN